MPSGFVHLRVHTEFSLVDSLIRVPGLIEAAVKHRMQAIAVTDFCNLFAAIKVFNKAIKANIKPILGSEVLCREENAYVHSSLILLCQSLVGYRNLTTLISKAYQEGQGLGKPLISYEWLKLHHEGLIVLSGGPKGALGQALCTKDAKRVEELINFFVNIFPNRFYLEVQRTGRANEVLYNEGVIEIANKFSIPLVATNDVKFIEKKDYEAHEARVAINAGYTLADARFNSHTSKEQYLRSTEEMLSLFDDLPEAVANTVHISHRCTVKLNFNQVFLPNFPTENNVPVDVYLSKLAFQGLKDRVTLIHQDSIPDLTEQKKIYEERLTLELQVINAMGFASYFLIVADFIRWAKENGVPVGPGRGSGAGSLVAYVLKITDLDPLQYDLLFERFLNPERVSMPDFDIDFCMEGRDRVIEYVMHKYGRENVSQIITFGTMAAKGVIRDVGRVLGYPYGFVDKIAKLIPFELGMTLHKALEQEPVLQTRYNDEEEVKELLDLAIKLEGLTKNAGKHAGGVIIAPKKLTDFTAIYCEPNSTHIVSQFDKDDVEAVGLVKFDFLGLKTLTIIAWTLEIINQSQHIYNTKLLDLQKIDLADEATFELLRTGKTTAIFQLESKGMQELINRLKPDCFEDIIALVALFRPGPLQSGMVDDFINRKHGRSQVLYPHKDLEPILKPTYGVILYQEQVMQIARVLANYTLGAADMLRRAMGKKKPEEMAKQREIFIKGAIGREVLAKDASFIFDLVEKFAGYGFNKSHSAAYALLSYQTAWLKVHFKAAFMAAVMSADMENTDKIVGLIKESEDMGLTILPPRINYSAYKFTLVDVNTIFYGLGAIKGIGAAAIESIIIERQHGAYKNLFDFEKRVDLRKVNRRVIEALIKSGSFDEWNIERSWLLASMTKAQGLAERINKNKEFGQPELMSLFEEKAYEEEYVIVEALIDDERLCGEKETLGF